MEWKKAALTVSGLAIAGATISAGIERASRQRSATAPVAAFRVEGAAISPVVVVAVRPTLSDILDVVLQERPSAAQISSRIASSGFPAESEEAHVSQILRRNTGDSLRANRIAAALVKEGRRRNVGSSLLVGVLLTENPDLDSKATSFVGARGLMQVMPFHAGKWGCSSPDLFDVEANICHGVAILADNLMRARTLPQALLGYNGCVRGTNTPDCFKYPRKVYGQARKSNSAAFAAPRATKNTRKGG